MSNCSYVYYSTKKRFVNREVEKIFEIWCGYLFLNSVPFEIDAASADAIADMHSKIEDKIFPISEEEYQEILDKKQ